MTELQELESQRRLVLLAEIAGLLHNLGKIEPNFLMQQIKDEEKKTAFESIRDQQQVIDPYHFMRFAVPKSTLFQDFMGPVTFQRDKDPESAVAFWEELTGLDVWSDEERIVLQALHEADWSGECRKKYPVVSKTLESARQVFIWLQGKGPLYIPRSVEHIRLNQEVSALGIQITELNKQVQDAPAEQKPIIGRELGQMRSRLKERLEELDKVKQQEKDTQGQFEAEFQKWCISLNEGTWSIADLLTLFWDDFFYQPDPEEEPDSDYKRQPVLKRWLKNEWFMTLPTLLILSHGEVSGAEKSWARNEQVDVEKQHWPPNYFATAFGYDRAKLDVWSLQSQRFDLINAALVACAAPAEQRATFIPKAREILQLGLGDTQWPINEIDLWDYASSIAALFKSGVARAVLDGATPTVDAMRWRFLSVRFDGLKYLSQAHHVTDLLGRRDSLDVAMDAVKTLIEETYPLGNEVYRDENGVVFVVPGWKDERPVLELQDEHGTTLKALIATTFREASRPKSENEEALIATTFREASRPKSENEEALPQLGGELEPVIHEGISCRGKQLQLGDYLAQRAKPLTSSPERMAHWWVDAQAQDQEICTVCGVRPVGYRPVGVDFPAWVRTKYAKERHVCCVCLHRRGRRAEQWLARDAGDTIWADEVVDGNGRFALLVGHFDLAGWLDGTLIETMQKPSSFARVRRIWETTHRFWQDVETSLVPDALASGETISRFRLKITPHHPEKLAQALGNYNAFELEIAGQRMSAIWVPMMTKGGNDKGYLLTTEHLTDLVRRWNIQQEKDDTPLTALQRWLEQHKDKPWSIYRPSGYNEPAQRMTLEVEFDHACGSDKSYTPHIPLLTEPSVFMALVPADQALNVIAAIKEKYEREMSKVQDRLPLHLGMVLAPRRTPMRVVLEAGQAMLQRPSAWEPWTVKPKPEKHEIPPAGLQADGNFAHWWEVPLEKEGAELTLRVAGCMGDGKTEDVWHTHFLIKAPLDANFDPHKDTQHVSKLSKGTTVYIAPSTFDFEYLDTTARRFEIAYDDNGRRRSRERASRPYSLGDVETLQEMWKLLSKYLKSSQLLWIHGLIEEKRRDWGQARGPSGDYAPTFERFVEDTLRTAEWRPKHPPLTDEFEALKIAAINGTLADVVDLYHEALKLNPETKEAQV